MTTTTETRADALDALARDTPQTEPAHGARAALTRCDTSGDIRAAARLVQPILADIHR